LIYIDLMLTTDQGNYMVQYAREVLTAYTKGDSFPKEIKMDDFQKKQGVFVTIHTFPSQLLRGCIGIPEPIMPLKHAIKEAAISVTHDPRFPPLSIEELSAVIVEVTILTPPELLIVKQPKEYLNKISIGVHGLIAEQGFRKGLLLPQVPVEETWDVETFLCHTCMKAGLPADAWYDLATKIYLFTGQIFYEKNPGGKVAEKKIHDS